MAQLATRSSVAAASGCGLTPSASEAVGSTCRCCGPARRLPPSASVAAGSAAAPPLAPLAAAAFAALRS
eukprot:1119526-Prymnesium_polylepis.1